MQGRRGGPEGPLYRYESVSVREFNSLLSQANHPGVWVWDHLRVRGSHAAHQKPYALVGVEGGYVPRQATTDINPWTGRVEEVFRPRRVRGLDGGIMQSVLGESVAPGFGTGPGQVNWGARPNRGTPPPPDRGAPDRGRLF